MKCIATAFAYFAIAILAPLLGACDDSEKQYQREQEERAVAERAARRKADAETEAIAISDPVQLSDLLDRRIKDWLTVTNGLIVIREDGGTRAFTLYSMPLDTQWMLRCDGRELELSMGPSVEGARMFAKTLSHARLSEEQCKALVVVAGEKMRAITRSQ